MDWILVVAGLLTPLVVAGLLTAPLQRPQVSVTLCQWPTRKAVRNLGELETYGQTGGAVGRPATARDA